MIRFRYSGFVNGSTPWAVTHPIKALGQQIEARWPVRHPTDGTVAGGSHSKWPTSDHGWDPRGKVRAIDIGTYLGQGGDLFAELLASRDPRIRYVIHRNEMFSSYRKGTIPPFTRRPYLHGGHDRHVHVSVLTDPEVDTDSSPWEIGDENVEEVVKGIQTSLKKAGFDPGTIDGKWGPNTQGAHEAMTKAAGKTVNVGLETETVKVVKSVRLTDG